jgi:hypothetical protein
MALFAVGLVLLGFVPEYREFSAGTFAIPWVLHVHGAIMGAWVASFFTQAYLGAKRDIIWHRTFGRFAVALAWLAWLSMLFVEWRALRVKALPDVPQGYDWLLPGPYVYLTFPIFLAWAYRERRRPSWHKRLMTFALFLSLQAAVQRYLWIPVTFGYWPFVAALDLCLLIPLIGYDMRTLRWRLHPATVRGITLLVFSQAMLLLLWGTPTWRGFAYLVAHAVHGGL